MNPGGGERSPEVAALFAPGERTAGDWTKGRHIEDFLGGWRLPESGLVGFQVLILGSSGIGWFSCSGIGAFFPHPLLTDATILTGAAILTVPAEHCSVTW